VPHPTHTSPPEGLPLPDPLAGTAYRAVRKLGSGGAGVIYEAVHVALGKRVAVKVLRLTLAGQPSSLERMRVEAQALAQLRSPHLVDVFDFGHTTDGCPFYAMELLAGADLGREVRRRGAFPPAEAVALVRQLLAGLAVAHRAGIVHRDVKLENLFLCEGPDGAPLLKILDFGIAKVLPRAEGLEPPSVRTGDGAVLGTPRFMSPEQALGRAVDERTDVYAAGVVLYELLTGRDPFHHLDGTEPLLRAHVSEEPPPPSRVAPQPIEPALDDVVMRAMAKRPEDRYGSADELSAALVHATELAASAGAWCSAPAPPPRGAPLPVACMLVLASAAVSALAGFLLAGVR
jgi:eukaryotic-like serine/threonine-protein kinase